MHGFLGEILNLRSHLLCVDIRDLMAISERIGQHFLFASIVVQCAACLLSAYCSDTQLEIIMSICAVYQYWCAANISDKGLYYFNCISLGTDIAKTIIKLWVNQA